MGRRHNLYLLDSSIPGDLKEDFPRGAATTSTECGLKNDADDMDVIGLAFERKALLVTADRESAHKCRTYQDRRQRCMFGLLILPQGIEVQRRLLAELSGGRKKLLHRQYDRQVNWMDVHDDNLAVVVHMNGNPAVTDLCNCPWE